MDELHRKCTSRLSSVSLTQFLTVARGVKFIGVLSIGGAMFGDRRRVSIVRDVALLFLLVDVGDGCFFLCMWCC